MILYGDGVKNSKHTLILGINRYGGVVKFSGSEQCTPYRRRSTVLGRVALPIGLNISSRIYVSANSFVVLAVIRWTRQTVYGHIILSADTAAAWAHIRVQNESRRPRTKMRWAVQLVAFLYLIPIRFVAPLTKTTIPANRCISITSSSGALRSAECSNSKCATIFCVRVTMTTKSNINTRAQPLTNQTNRNPYSEHTTRQHAMV